MARDTDGLASPNTETEPPHPVARISRLEWTAATVAAIVLVCLVVAEPAILEAPFENSKTIGFVLIGTIAAAVGLLVMLRLRVPPAIRVLVLGVPFVAVSWWLISPFFIDEVVNDDFETSIADAAERTDPVESIPETVVVTTVEPTSDSGPTPDTASVESSSTSTSQPPGPALLGVGTISGLAGHEGTGDAGIFRLENGLHVLRLENLDIQNGPDLRLYLVPGADQTTPSEGSFYFGELRGNVGNQTYEIDTDFMLLPGEWTVLVWCEAFSVEFVGATLTIT